jgi:serine O-acetyltransferase
VIEELCRHIIADEPDFSAKLVQDLRAVRERDPACRSYLQPFLYFKGFVALEASRVAHSLWKQGREILAFHLQNRISEILQVDIHPAACLGLGLFLDHATGIVIGETTVIGDRVSILQSVTLGGNGKERGDRHPKIGRGVLISVGAKILGNIRRGSPYRRRFRRAERRSGAYDRGRGSGPDRTRASLHRAGYGHGSFFR